MASTRDPVGVSRPSHGQGAGLVPGPAPRRRSLHAERRRSARMRRRIPCTVQAGRTWAGLTVDLTEDGLFVRTRAALAVGTRARIVLQSGLAEIPLRGIVVRRRTPPPGLGRMATGGIAIALEAPAASYLALVRAGR